MNAPGSAAEPPEGLLAQAADALAWPLLLLGADADLLWANRAATALLLRHSVLTLRHGRLHMVGRPTGELVALLGSAQPEGDAPQGGPPPVHRHFAAPALTLTVQALSGPPRPRWMLLLTDRDAPGVAPADVDAWAAAHRLSAAETRVLQRLAAGDSPHDAAATLGVAPATVRSQLRSIGRKTGLAGAAALQQALLRLPRAAADGA